MISPENRSPEDLDASVFEALADRFAQEIRQGDSPEIAAYATQYPDHADAIHRLFPVLEMMERKGTPVDDLSEDGLFEAEMAQLNATQPFRKLGDYRIVREIGRGGMGIVFEAHQESLNRTVALKLLPSSAQFDARRQQRFQQEAQASAKLHHTNIVPVFGVGAHQETSYFVMQYIEGQPLDSVLTELSRIRSGNAGSAPNATDAIAKANVSTIATAIGQFEIGNSSAEASESDSAETNRSDSSVSSATTIANQGIFWRNIAKIGTQVASALEHAHSRKTLHRDIKPSNLLIDAAGAAWVTDFGLAKYFESPDLTRTGEVVGTLRYMSPEQLNGNADERSDIFALGLTLYEMAALRPAYDANDRKKLMQQALEASPRRLKTVIPQVPRDLETVIHKCIASDPSARYQTATQLKNDLERFVAGEPVHARRINPLQRAAKWCRRRPAVASLIAALILSLIGGSGGVAWQWHKTSEALELANVNLAEANRQKQVSQDHFQQARESVNRFFAVVSQQRLLREPGFAPLRKELLQEALDYHNQFVAQYGDDDELRFELAQSLYHIVEIEGTLSANPEHAESLQEPITIFSDLVEDHPDETAYQLWLARCLRLKSNILRRFDLQASLATLDDAIKVIETLRQDYPDQNLGAEELAKSYQMLGLSYEQIDKASGKTDRSLEYYTNAFLIRQQIFSEEPDNVQNKTLMAELHRDLGITFRRRGEGEKAIEQYDLALALLEPIVEAHPDDVMARNSLASIANSIGFFYGGGLTSQDYDKSLSYYELAKTQYQELASQSPLVIQYQDGLARAALNAGGVYHAQGEFEKALEYRTYAANIREKLCNQNPSAPHIRSSWAVSLNGVGASFRDLGRIDESIAMHERALEQHKRVASGNALQTVARLRLIDGLVQMTRAHSEGKMFQEAVADIEAIDEFVLPSDSSPLFSQAREYAITASKVGQLTAEELTDSVEQLRVKCIEQSKSSFTKAAENGFDVVRGINSDTAFNNFCKYPECSEIRDWVLQRFSDDSDSQ